ncbi:hypothetical protein SBX64_06120 [Vibrio rhizosphaerae]|uniref:Uncharacterized protein n=1 Tax=Vibrio rhizosphaerae TaxID=398736 RepID=A0ABU4IRS7_9VIBR|nr:hypothetical protein [Vibrio rhizosphaerae]MDW6092117.1 hypothetical protein [Vibrio rhizosphaerae]
MLYSQNIGSVSVRESEFRHHPNDGNLVIASILGGWIIIPVAANIPDLSAYSGFIHILFTSKSDLACKP